MASIAASTVCANSAPRPSSAHRTTGALAGVRHELPDENRRAASPAAPKQLVPHCFPGDSRTRISFVVGPATIQLCTLLLGERQGLSILGDAVPDVLDEIEALGDAQLAVVDFGLGHV